MFEKIATDSPDGGSTRVGSNTATPQKRFVVRGDDWARDEHSSDEQVPFHTTSFYLIHF